jgi:molybdenum cofactor cytidylyltransferase
MLACRPVVDASLSSLKEPVEGFITGIVLAAGVSRRMGRPKQLLPLDGRPLLQHAVDNALASSLDEVIVVLGYEAEQVRAEVSVPEGRARVVLNPRYAAGQGTSLLAGLHAADARACAAAILLGDQPQVTPAIIERIIGTYRADSGSSARGDGSPSRGVIRPVYRRADGELVPAHPAVIDRRVWRLLEGLGGDEGLRGLVKAHPEWVREIPIEGEPPADIDTPDEYQVAIARAGGR